MVDLRILFVDDPEDLKVLRSKSKKVPKVTPQLVDLAQRMLEAMREANGVGLAAPQVGVLYRFFVAEIPADYEAEMAGKIFILFNPEIVKSKGEQVGLEGCLSIPGWIGEVARDDQVTVEALDEKGKKVRLKVQGYVARVFQHEIDHLDGVLFTDKLTDPSTLRPVQAGQEEEEEVEAALG